MTRSLLHSLFIPIYFSCLEFPLKLFVVVRVFSCFWRPAFYIIFLFFCFLLYCLFYMYIFSAHTISTNFLFKFFIFAIKENIQKNITISCIMFIYLFTYMYVTNMCLSIPCVCVEVYILFCCCNS